ncbi:MAG: PAS domain-containing sensor histidine kinase, partial [Deltaproteobacteria bacterium]
AGGELVRSRLAGTRLVAITGVVLQGYLFLHARFDSDLLLTPANGLSSSLSGRQAMLREVLTIATGVAILLLGMAARARRGLWFCVWCVLTLGLAFTMTCSDLYSLAENHLPAVEATQRLIVPLCLLLLNTAVFLAEPINPILREFVGPRLGAKMGRYLLWWGLFCVVPLGLLRVRAQNSGWIKLEAGTAMLVGSMLFMFAFTTWKQAKVLNQYDKQRSSTMRQLTFTVAQRRDLILQLQAEQSKFDGVLRATQDYALIATDRGGTIVVFNNGAERMLGYRAEEVIKKQTPLLFHLPAEMQRCADKFGTAANFDVFTHLALAGRSDTRDWTYVRKDGSKILVLLSLAQTLDEQGNKTGVLGIARDVTKQRRDEEILNTFLKIGSELKCICDHRGEILSINPAFERVLGYRKEDLLGRSCLEFVHHEDIEKTKKTIQSAVVGPSTGQVENRWRHRDGSYHSIYWHALASQQAETLYACGWDTTSERAIAAEQQAQAKFEKNLIGIVSHDLRNPVSAIRLSAGLVLREPELTVKTRRNMGRISLLAERMERMIHDLLDFTAIRIGGGLHLHPVQTNIDELALQRVEEIALSNQSHDIMLKKRGTGRAFVDPDRISQVLTNLISNAVHYSPHNSKVTVTVVSEIDGLHLSVHNEGLPMAADTMSRLFQPLQRGIQKGSNPSRNVGLGLFIVNEVVQAHHGSIDVTSSAQSGTIFAISLPAAKDASSTVGSLSNEPGSSVRSHLEAAIVPAGRE